MFFPPFDDLKKRCCLQGDASFTWSKLVCLGNSLNKVSIQIVWRPCFVWHTGTFCNTNETTSWNAASPDLHQAV